jgi:lipase (class 3)
MASIGDITVDVRASVDPYELACSLALCGLIEGPAPASLPALVVPANWELVFDSPVIGVFDNKWQLWKSPGGRYAIIIRGTTPAPASVIEDLLSVMIPARGSISIQGGNLPYYFAADPAAAVHAGFALGALLLLLDREGGILAKLAQLVPAGSPLIVSGHSQGAAIATLIRGFFEFFPPSGIARGGDINSYFHAQPKPGNDHFARDIERLPSAYRITNSLDWVPQLPLTLQGLTSLNDPNPLSTMRGGTVWRFVAGALDALRAHLSELALDKLAAQVAKMSAASIYEPAAAAINPGQPQGLLFTGGLNFEPAGIPITLEGEPGLNPADPKDAFWQHHAAQYLALWNSSHA